MNLKVISFFLLLFGVSSLHAETLPQFSADEVKTRGGEVIEQGKVYSSPQGVRIESTLMGRSKMTMIMNIAKDVMWSVTPEKGVYMETPLRKDISLGGKLPPGLKEECLGNEVVNGYPAEKCRVTGNVGGRPVDSTIWKAKNLEGVVIKTATKDIVMELKNIVTGPQPDSLFQEPQGLRKMQAGQGGQQNFKDAMENLRKQIKGGGR